MSAALAWVGAGLALLVGEVLAPGVFLMWLGLAALGAGAATAALGLAFPAQAVLFAALAAALCAAGWRTSRARPPGNVNSPRSGLVGRVATVLAADGAHGRVRLGDSDWPARPDGAGPMPDQGAAVEVVAVEGTTLLVRPRAMWDKAVVSAQEPAA